MYVNHTNGQVNTDPRRSKVDPMQTCYLTEEEAIQLFRSRLLSCDLLTRWHAWCRVSLDLSVRQLALDFVAKYHREIVACPELPVS